MWASQRIDLGTTHETTEERMKKVLIAAALSVGLTSAV